MAVPSCKEPFGCFTGYGGELLPAPRTPSPKGEGTGQGVHFKNKLVSFSQQKRGGVQGCRAGDVEDGFLAFASHRSYWGWGPHSPEDSLLDKQRWQPQKVMPRNGPVCLWSREMRNGPEPGADCTALFREKIFQVTSARPLGCHGRETFSSLHSVCT